MATPAFRVGLAAHVAKQMRDLSQRAASLGIKDMLVEAFESLFAQLHSEPLRLGDPVPKTKKEGGLLCVGVVEPVSVRFLVFDEEKIVVLLDVKPLTRFFPSEE